MKEGWARIWRGASSESLWRNLRQKNREMDGWVVMGQGVSPGAGGGGATILLGLPPPTGLVLRPT